MYKLWWSCGYFLVFLNLYKFKGFLLHYFLSISMELLKKTLINYCLFCDNIWDFSFCLFFKPYLPIPSGVNEGFIKLPFSLYPPFMLLSFNCWHYYCDNSEFWRSFFVIREFVIKFLSIDFFLRMLIEFFKRSLLKLYCKANSLILCCKSYLKT